MTTKVEPVEVMMLMMSDGFCKDDVPDNIDSGIGSDDDADLEKKITYNL